MIWLIGSKGMLGTEFSAMCESAGIACVGTDREVDITDRVALDGFIQTLAESGTPVRWILNCAAYTAVDKAEDDVEVCRHLNTEGPANIAAAARKAGARLIHISTDYVFNGNGTRPYREDDLTDPIGVYGLTKRDGERAALSANEATWIIRTSWLYGRYGNNFVHTMLRLMNERDSLAVVNDQRGTPTWASDLCETLLSLISAVESGKDVQPGIYHVSGKGDISWFDFACEIYRLGRESGILEKNCAVNPCTSAEFPAKVTRPAYSVLDKTKIESTLGIAVPDWQSSLKKFLESKDKKENA